MTDVRGQQPQVGQPVSAGAAQPEVAVRPASQEDSAGMVRVHLAAFPGFFLTFLGPAFLRRLYDAIIRDPDGCAYVAVREAEVVGFVAGAARYPQAWSRLTRRGAARLALAAMPAVVRRPSALRRLLTHVLRAPGPTPAPDDARLMSIAVLPSCQGQAVGQRLAAAFVGEMARRQAAAVTLTTDRDGNERANRFYAALGFVWQEAYTTPDGRAMNFYRLDLAPGAAQAHSAEPDSRVGWPTVDARPVLPAKRALDVVVSLALLLILAPVLAAIALLVRLSSPGPVVFRQTRVGQGGRPFQVLKFRTMRVTRGGAQVTAGGDRRITPVGERLRRWKLDELPQLVNVLRGEMSLVGPRPEVPEYVAHYSREQAAVLAVRPGVTGPTQLEFRDEEQMLAGQVDVETYYLSTVMPAKLALDLQYAATASFWSDASVLIRTVGRVLRLC